MGDLEGERQEIPGHRERQVVRVVGIVGVLARDQLAGLPVVDAGMSRIVLVDTGNRRRRHVHVHVDLTRVLIRGTPTRSRVRRLQGQLRGGGLDFVDPGLAELQLGVAVVTGGGQRHSARGDGAQQVVVDRHIGGGDRAVLGEGDLEGERHQLARGHLGQVVRIVRIVGVQPIDQLPEPEVGLFDARVCRVGCRPAANRERRDVAMDATRVRVLVRVAPTVGREVGVER